MSSQHHLNLDPLGQSKCPGQLSAITMAWDTIGRCLIENFGNEEDCPCCCHNVEEAECVREHGEGGCCLVSEYTELDRCCYSSEP